MGPCAGSGLACGVSVGVILGIRAGMIQFPEMRFIFLNLPASSDCAFCPTGPITKIICRDSDG